MPNTIAFSDLLTRLALPIDRWQILLVKSGFAIAAVPPVEALRALSPAKIGRRGKAPPLWSILYAN